MKLNRSETERAGLNHQNQQTLKNLMKLHNPPSFQLINSQIYAILTIINYTRKAARKNGNDSTRFLSDVGVQPPLHFSGL